MKRQIRIPLRRDAHNARNQIRVRTLLLTLIPFLIWGFEVRARDWVIQPRCATAPENCVAAQVLPIDRVSLGLESGAADGYSYFTQNFTGAAALVTITGWNLAFGGAGSLVNAAVDALFLLQVTAWDGVAIEASHLLTQRPRPFVYQDPKVRGTEAAHYTSFYSGHTSFVAAAVFGLLFLLFYRGAPAWVLALTAAAGQSLILSTGIFRIFAGRHFITDVITGALAGACVAYAVARKNKIFAGPKLAS